MEVDSAHNPLRNGNPPADEGVNLSTELLFTTRCCFPPHTVKKAVWQDSTVMGTETEMEMVQHGQWMLGKRWVIVVLQEFLTYNQYLRALEASDSTVQLEAIFLLC